MNITTNADGDVDWYLVGGTHYLYHFSCCDGTDPTDVDDDGAGVVTVASAITYGLSNYWTRPCAAGTWSYDGYEHGNGINGADPTCEIVPTTAPTSGDTACSVGMSSPNSDCPLAGACPDPCATCSSGKYLQVESFNKHFDHMTEDACARCPVGKSLLKLISGALYIPRHRT